MVHTLSALAPLRLAPVGRAAEISRRTAEVGSGAAKSSSTLLVDNRSAVLSSLGSSSTGSRLRGLGHRVALSVASLAAGSAVESLVLDVVLGAAVSGRRAAAVEVAVATNARAGHTSLGASANIDFGDLGREGGGGLAGAQGGWGSSALTGGSGTGEGFEACLCVAISSTSIAPSILAAAFSCSTDLVPVCWAAVLGESGRRKRDNGEDGVTHFD